MKSWKLIASLSYQEIRALQERRLCHFIKTYVYPFSPYYRKLFDDHHIHPRHIRSFRDLKNIPLTSKLDLVSADNPQRFRDFILQPDPHKIRQFWPKSKLFMLALRSLALGKSYARDTIAKEYRPIFMTFTTGTTQSPVPFTYSCYDVDNLHCSGARMMDLFKPEDDCRIMNIFPFAPHLAFWQTFFGAIKANIFSLSTGGGKVMGSEGNLTAIMRTRPAMIVGVPGYVYHLVRLAQERHEDLSFLKKIVLGASKVTLGYKQKLAAMLETCGAKDVFIFSTYGFTEARSAWSECPTDISISSGYHLYPDKEIFEIIDPKSGEPLDDSQDGELVYTALDSRASVVLRYRTGDFVKGGIRHDPCPYCGLRTLRLSSDIARLSDIKGLNLSKIKGVLVNLDHFAEAFNSLAEIDEWQIEIRKHNDDPYDCDELLVYVTPKESIHEEAFGEKLKSQLMGLTEVSPNEVRFIPLNEMLGRLELETANKEKRIVDARPKE